MTHHREATLDALLRTAHDLESALASVRDAIANLSHDEAPSVVTYIDPRFADCIGRGVPDGYDTVLGYLAKHHPEMLELIDYADPSATARDGFWLAHRWSRVDYVPAPPVLRAAGILRVRCWPVDLLRERFAGGC
jgi:hypothetical protein